MWIVEERPHDDLANSGVGHRMRIHKEVVEVIRGRNKVLQGSQWLQEETVNRMVE